MSGRAGKPITVTGRPIEISALESFTVTIETPPLTCHRCSVVLPDRKANLVLPGKIATERLAARGRKIVSYCFCESCAAVVFESTRLGLTCYHGAPIREVCRGCVDMTEGGDV